MLNLLQRKRAKELDISPSPVSAFAAYDRPMLRIRTCIGLIAATLVAWMLAPMSGVAHSAPLDRYSILANTQPAGTQPGRLELRLSSAGPAHILGSIEGGNRLEGFFAADSHEIVWIRWSATGPSQAYVGTYTEDRVGGLSLGGISREIRGTLFALNAAGGASSQRNAFGFRAWNRFTLQQIPPTRSANPANSLHPHSEPAGPWWVTANTTKAALVLEVAANGAVTGKLMGDPIAGHYAAAAGTIAFLRSHNGKPVQLYYGVSVRKPVIPAVPNFELVFDGALVALSPIGGASEDKIVFPFNARNEGKFVTLTSAVNNRCLTTRLAQPLDHAQLRLGPCISGEPSQQFAFLTTDNATGVVVARHSGRCLDIPDGDTRPGRIVQQFSCHGGPAQQPIIQPVTPSACRPGDCQAIKLNGLCLTATDPGVGRTFADVLTSECASGSGRPEIEFFIVNVP